MLTRALAIAGGVLLLLLAVGLLFEEDSAIPVAVGPDPGFQVLPDAGEDRVASPEVEDALVYQAQELLLELGYAPGAVDGVAGRRTVQAARTFQSDYGLVADGRVDERLLDALHEALMAEGGGGPAPALPAAGPFDVSGIWVDDEGISYRVLQQGNLLQMEAYDGYGNLVGGGEGRISGNRLDYALMGTDGSHYIGQGLFSADGQRLDYRSTETSSGMQESGSLYRQ
jgi:peptidoglycan hydrolase-like protein with peptidoglycan-binding domain